MKTDKKIVSPNELSALIAFLVENHPHRWIETHILGFSSKENWGGTKARDCLWKFGINKTFKNFLVDIHTEYDFEQKIKKYSNEIKKNNVDISLLKNIWLSSQNVYIFQRVIHNDNAWTRPSEGRLGYSADGSYLEKNGIGHEDWNFNIDLTINDEVYGYLYRTPAEHKQTKKFNVVFATLDDGNWSIVGFYQNARFVSDGCPLDKKILSKKLSDLEFLRDKDGLGKEWDFSKEEMESKLEDEFQSLKLCVHFKDITVLPAPVDVSNDVILPKNTRITTYTTISEQDFFRILQISKSTMPTISGVLTPDEADRRERASQYFDEDEEDFPEGKIFYKKHRLRERNATVIKNAKNNFLKKHGKLFCECCKFNFQEKYGDVGELFIEAHHTIAISDINHSGKTKVEDIVLLCSNCHRMIHRKRPWLSIIKLRNLLREENGSSS